MKKRMHKSHADRGFTAALSIIMTFVCIVVLYPLYYILIASFTDPYVVNSGRLLLYPVKPFFDGYARIFEYRPLWLGYARSFLYMGMTVACSLTITIPAAYVLSRRDMVFRKGLMMVFTITMFFSGGMIPSYLLMRSLGILNTMWAVVLPVSCSAWNLIVARTFFQESIPVELLEASRIDGCDDFRFFFSVVLPLSKTIIAVIGLVLCGRAVELIFQRADVPDGGAHDAAAGGAAQPDPDQFHHRVAGRRHGPGIPRAAGGADEVRRNRGRRDPTAPAVPVFAEIFRQGHHGRLGQRLNTKALLWVPRRNFVPHPLQIEA